MLKPDNFTDLKKTPWAGEKIGSTYKKTLVDNSSRLRIGESWEFSCDPQQPSYLKEHPVGIQELIDQSSPDALFGPNENLEYGNYSILVKILDAGFPLSFQVHPADHDPYLQTHECGKPESWLILAAEESSGIYLGFKNPIHKDQLREMLLEKVDLSQHMQFIPVKENDYFEINPGVPHAIGSGVTLLEPQRLLNGKSGKTYRLWDWNRNYNSQGEFDPGGKPRELHIEECLNIIQPEKQYGLDFATKLKRQPRPLLENSNLKILEFPANLYYQSSRINLNPETFLQWHTSLGYGIIIVTEGSLLMESQFGIETICEKGQSALLPHLSNPFKFKSIDSCSFALFTPSYSTNSWKTLSG